jgi:hypothetical protein
VAATMKAPVAATMKAPVAATMKAPVAATMKAPVAANKPSFYSLFLKVSFSYNYVIINLKHKLIHHTLNFKIYGIEAFRISIYV